MELQLTYLAKELEVERMRRENLQKQVQLMQEKLVQQKFASEEEVEMFKLEKETRENNVKRPNMDVEDLKVL